MVDHNKKSDASVDSWQTLQPRLQTMENQLRRLLSSTPLKFDSTLRSTLPEQHGIYRIFAMGDAGATIRAGRTKTAAGGLRQRIYQNHFMGDQKGNLRAQLVRDGKCVDMERAKSFIRDNLLVQILAVEDDQERTWLEHFMLGVLRPEYCD